ncbi:MAG: FtsX-like permease family protein [Oscillospiraceae bacterium]|nr:FtsX-like permease family protein [Oscillospiraceae bacterium]MBR6657324.1 FtsX-like permease family protein [Oscillospiraceae bacterium]
MRKIALRGLIGQKRNTLLLWSVVALAFLFLVLSTTLITSLQKTDEQQRNNTYGKWQVMVSDSDLTGIEFDDESSKTFLSDDVLSEITSFSENPIVLPMVSVSGIDYFSGDNKYYITPFSEDFASTGNLTLKEGKWPESKNEIALEYARLSSLNLKLGDSFTVVSQVHIPANDEYLARLDEIIELSKEDILAEGKDIYQRKAWKDYNPSILNFNKPVYEEFFSFYLSQREGSLIAMVLSDDAHPDGQIIPFDEMTEEQFIKTYSFFVNSFSDTGTNITEYMEKHMTEEEKAFYFGPTADLIGYENLNVRTTVNKRDIIIHIPFTYTVCGVVDTFSDRWDTGMLPLPSGFITSENYDVYIGAQEKVVEKYYNFAFKPYNKIVFLSSEKTSPRELWENCRIVLNSRLNENRLITEDSIYSPFDFSELRLNRFSYPSSSEGSGQTLTLVTIILFITTVSAVFQIFFTQMRKRLRRIVLMKSIGAESRQIGQMLLWEFFYFWVSTLPVGTFFGLFGAHLTVFFLEKAQQRDIIYTIDPTILLFAVLAGTLALFIGMMIPSIMAIGVPLTGRTSRKKPLAPPKKEVQQNFLNVTLRGLFANRGRTFGNAALCIFMMLIMTLCIFIGFRFMTPYRETVERDNRPDYFLQLPFSASDRQLPEYIEELEALGVCESIEVQRTAQDAVLSKDSVESFLLERAFGNDMKVITDSFGAPDFEGYPIELYAVSSESEFFEKFNAAATVGSLDKEAFEAGNEVLVMIPLYKDNGKGEEFAEGTGWERVSSSGIDTTFYEEYKHVYKKDGGLSVGDKITIGAQTRYVGGIKYDYKIVTDTARVGAIIYYFPNEGVWPISGSAEGYQIVCSSKFAGHILPNSMRTRSSNEIRSFKIMYVSSGYGTTDFYINAKEGLSKYDVDTALLVYGRSEYMDIEFYHESNSKLLQDAINNILLVCLLGLTAVLLALMIFANTISSDIEQERNKIGILQSLGVSNKQLIKRQLYIGLAVSGGAVLIANILLWSGVALYALLSDAVLGNLLWGYPWWLHFIACVVLAAVITVLYIIPMKSIQKYLPIENIKTRK